MDYLTASTKSLLNGGADHSPIHARGKDVIVIGGGDTGTDCVATAMRQGCKSLTQLEIMQQPPMDRAADNPWPEWPKIFRVSSAHEEGGERLYRVSTERFTGDESGHVRQLHLRDVAEGSESRLDADLVLLAMGFVGPQRNGLLNALDVRLTERGNVWRDDTWMTSVPGVFTAGDMQRGQSLIVWAIADGRDAAGHVDAYLRRA
jgi:glutamate synthase (NADPH/NADH) small chain